MVDMETPCQMVQDFSDFQVSEPIARWDVTLFSMAETDGVTSPKRAGKCVCFVHSWNVG